MTQSGQSDRIPCRVCDRGALEYRTVYRYGTPIAILGGLAALVGGMLIGVVVIFGIAAIFESHGPSDILAAGVVGMLFAPGGLLGLVALLAGCFLARRISNLQCSHCGTVTVAL